MRISVIINTLDRARLLVDALQSLRYQTHNDYEVVVVNGPSRDDTIAVLSKYEGEIKILSCTKANLSMSRNIGICAADGDIVAFMDDDAVADPRWLEMLSSEFIGDQVAAVGGFVYNHTGAEYQCRYNICDRLGETQVAMDFDSTDVLSFPGAWYYPSTIGTNSSFRRDVLLDIGGFDEALIYNTDETDVCLRMVDRGYRVKISTKAIVYHRYAASYMRDAAKVPRTLYPAAVCKSYFAFRNGLPASSPQRVFQALRDFERSLNQHNDWLYNNHSITEQQLDGLNADVERGIRDGMQKALSSPAREIITRAKLDEHRRPFLPFSARLAPANGGRLRICLMSSEFPPGRAGGIARWTYLLAAGLSRLGHEVHVFTPGAHFNTVTFEENVWVHRIADVWHPLRRLDLPFELPQVLTDRALTFKTELERCSAEAEFDVISYPIWENPGLACLLDGRYRVAVSLHSAYGLMQPYKPDWHESMPYYWNHVGPMIDAERWVYHNAPVIIANSNVIVSEYDRIFGKREGGSIHLVPHGVEVPAPSTHERKLCQGLMGHKPRGTVDVLYVGRLENRKGIDLILSAIPALCRKFKNVRFTICGEDVVEGGLHRTHREVFLEQFGDAPGIGERVRFAGAVSDEELQAHYATCDIFVAPSRFESFGLIFIEAMAHAKPVIALNVGGAQEIIRDGIDGLLADPENPDSLGKCLERLIGEKELRTKMGAQAGARFLEHYTTEIMASEMERAYYQLIDGRRSYV